jgi:streptomycin 6-kinase
VAQIEKHRIQFPQRWRIQTAVLQVETFSSRIWSVQLNSGERAVVKELKPFEDMADELRGAHYLSWRDGIGAVRLLDVDGSCMLLEYGGNRLLSQELATRGDAYATEVMGEVLARILSGSDRPPPAELQPLNERFGSLFAKARPHDDGDCAELYREAAGLAHRLLEDPWELRPLHGDLHHDNVIQGPRGWLVIDPKGVLGDPAFEAANVFYNPLDRADLCLDPERIARLAEVLSRAIGQEPRRLLDYGVAYGCLSAAWNAGDANHRDEQSDLAVAAAIRDVRKMF